MLTIGHQWKGNSVGEGSIKEGLNISSGGGKRGPPGSRSNRLHRPEPTSTILLRLRIGYKCRKRKGEWECHAEGKSLAESGVEVAHRCLRYPQGKSTNVVDGSW